MFDISVIGRTGISNILVLWLRIKLNHRRDVVDALYAPRGYEARSRLRSCNVSGKSSQD